MGIEKLTRGGYRLAADCDPFPCDPSACYPDIECNPVNPCRPVPPCDPDNKSCDPECSPSIPPCDPNNPTTGL